MYLDSRGEGKKSFNALTGLIPRNNQFLSLLPTLHPNSHVPDNTCAVSPSPRVMRGDRAAPVCPGSSQLSGPGRAHSVRDFSFQVRHTKLWAWGHLDVLQSIQGCPSCGELGLGTGGTQDCAEGAQGSSESMMETGNAFVVVAAFVTIYKSPAQVVK